MSVAASIKNNILIREQLKEDSHFSYLDFPLKFFLNSTAHYGIKTENWLQTFSLVY